MQVLDVRSWTSPERWLFSSSLIGNGRHVAGILPLLSAGSLEPFIDDEQSESLTGPQPSFIKQNL